MLSPQAVDPGHRVQLEPEPTSLFSVGAQLCLASVSVFRNNSHHLFIVNNWIFDAEQTAAGSVPAADFCSVGFRQSAPYWSEPEPTLNWIRFKQNSFLEQEGNRFLKDSRC